ncbi:netrin receptor DCC-like [Melospiza melodia melodia]|uniref:netrin receptor DCC-like n=1 Tax=Melospiza melodia melodia TaxID=1914991 RepID=UPI002FCEFB4F
MAAPVSSRDAFPRWRRPGFPAHSGNKMAAPTFSRAFRQQDGGAQRRLPELVGGHRMEISWIWLLVLLAGTKGQQKSKEPNSHYVVSLKAFNNAGPGIPLYGSATTKAAAPSSPPKDLTVISRQGKFRNAELSWQPPVEANGKITGYTIFYSPRKNAPISEWIPQAVGAERLSQPIPEALLDSGSFFRIQARNSKDRAPSPNPSITVRLKVPIGEKTPNSNPGVLLLILGISGGVSAVAAAVGAWICSKKHQERKKKNQGKRTLSQTEPRPPDLWIHHEEMELKNVEKTSENSKATAPNPQEIQNEPKNSEMEPGNPNIPQPVPEPEHSGIGRRGKLNAAVVSGIPVPNPEPPFPHLPLRPLPFPSLPSKILGESEAGNPEEIPSRIIPTACVRPTHPLRSFGNSFPPKISYNSILQQAPFKPLPPRLRKLPRTPRIPSMFTSRTS